MLIDRAAHPTEQDRFEVRIALTNELSTALHGRLVDIVILNDVSPLFAQRVLREGLLLRCTDEQALHAFRRDIDLMACDLAPFVERSRRTALAVLTR